MFAALPILVPIASAQSAQPAANTPLVLTRGNFHGVPWRDPGTTISGPIGLAAPAGAHLSYFGGPVVSNAHVVQVLYGSGTYLPQVTVTTTPSMASFFGDILGANSGYINLLTQYNTPASDTDQIIGNGTFDGLFQIVPSAGNNGTTIDDTNIQAELLAQITAGHLPAPLLDVAGNVNTIYMIYFPHGKTITQGGSSSCVPGGFCAYHGTTSNTFNSKNLLYGVLPDMQAGSGCDLGCGAGTVFDNYTSVTSHELTETITDADVGIAITFAPPLAWYDMVNGEIGDICNAQQGSYTANGTAYTIQLEFSNAANDCVLPPPAGPDFGLSASPSSLTIAQSGSGNSTITVAPSGGFIGSVTLSASGLPAGVTANFGTNPTTSTSVVTFTASATAATGTFLVTITGTSGALTHATIISLTVNATIVGDFSISVSPATLVVKRATSSNYTVTVTDNGGFNGNVDLSVSGVPAHTIAIFSPTPVNGSGTSTLQISAIRGTSRGTSTLIITGKSGSLTHSTTAILTIQ
jgi:hypothetical protein